MTGCWLVGFGGGCHWCTEAVFMTLHGVSSVKQGFIKSEFPNNAFSEAVIVNYDADVIGLHELIEVHLSTHASASQHSMREKYRSAIYTFDEVQHEQCVAALAQVQQNLENTLITQILPYVRFKASGTQYWNYYYKDKTRPFCRTYIEPKIKLLRQRFSRLIID